jgi:hypothetical protein
LRARPGHRGAGKNSRLAQSLPGRSLNPTKDRHGGPPPLGGKLKEKSMRNCPPRLILSCCAWGAPLLPPHGTFRSAASAIG